MGCYARPGVNGLLFVIENNKNCDFLAYQEKVGLPFLQFHLTSDNGHTNTIEILHHQSSQGFQTFTVLRLLLTHSCLCCL